jgi:hypothetical protein
MRAAVAPTAAQLPLAIDVSNSLSERMDSIPTVLPPSDDKLDEDGNDVESDRFGGLLRSPARSRVLFEGSIVSFLVSGETIESVTAAICCCYCYYRCCSFSLPSSCNRL